MDAVAFGRKSIGNAYTHEDEVTPVGGVLVPGGLYAAISRAATGFSEIIRQPHRL